jgi:DNA-binding NarL/FixJ family response regulator
MRAMTKRTDDDRITIVIADDHRSFGEALQVALDKEQDLTVIEVVTDCSAAVETTAVQRPDIVLMDLWMPGVDGIEATQRIRKRSAGKERRARRVIDALSRSSRSSRPLEAMPHRLGTRLR